MTPHDSGRFNHATQLIDFAHILVGGSSDEHATVRDFLDEPVFAQQMKGLTQSVAGNAQAFGQPVLA
ncbi:hypothetical protein QDX23_10275 [Auritidibacter ignavus]|nr:hypothetical protein [Auritidibacter ignavus]WGH90486.1 hypothetical protein QDX23_10275 [Auritidibacter ignavus]